MSAEEAFLTLKNYFEQRPAARHALSVLREGIEIGVTIGGTVDCALYYFDGNPHVERRTASQPDITFEIRPETVYVLNDQPSEDIGDIGVAIFKEVLAGNIRIRVPGSLFNILRNGYLEILRLGGRRVSTFLADRGLRSISNIVRLIKKMKG